MNTDSRTARNIGATVNFTLEQALAQGFAKKQATGIVSTVGNLHLTGPRIAVKINTGEVLEDGIALA
jgi:hypothetical protein